VTVLNRVLEHHTHTHTYTRMHAPLAPPVESRLLSTGVLCSRLQTATIPDAV
jgi:hypothetical protein